MNNLVSTGLTIFSGVLVFELGVALFLTGLSYGGSPGKSLSSFLCRAPGLDVTVSLIIWVPWVISGFTGGWIGFVGCLLGQIIALQLWVVVHERLHAEYLRGPRINAYN
jgi:hypothetical protein